ncbi:sodium:calcium antiporter [Kocuria rosea subsp. polaris]|uniref:Sodium:calcium antiporter n=1 Tax=Kocuria rosea subsp. polaris TaxID=136273 RepID=A0A0W8IQQ6_KOCRO|nr:calcium/sodium antiporter [Kocuria polaris]KUG62107.1 sodium:calcium antiporter [Kocuria polaris]
MDLLDAGRIVAGLVLLVLGGELLVRGASALARRVGISSLVVGLTVVSAATSAPELAVTVGAVLRDEPGLAVGNVVGSNIVNVLLILGASALVLPLAVTQRLVRLDLPLVVALSAALLLVSLDGRIGALDGVLLLSAVVAHTVLTVVLGRRGAEVPAGRPSGEHGAGAGAGPGDEPAPASVPRSVLLVVLGVALLVAGASLLVDGAVSIATSLGVSSLVVGLTVVAVGTSLPELATSIIAVRRGERDLAVGNVVGSNLFNIGVVLGLPALIARDGIPVAGAAVALDIPVMLAASVALLPVAFTGFAVARWEGALFVGLYAAYTGYVVLAATEHDALEGFTLTMAWFVLPLVVLTLAALTAYELGLRRGRRDAGRSP